MTQTIFLEFQWEGNIDLAAIGTESIFYRDGRWSELTFIERKGTTSLRFVGYSTPHGKLVRF